MEVNPFLPQISPMRISHFPDWGANLDLFLLFAMILPLSYTHPILFSIINIFLTSFVNTGPIYFSIKCNFPLTNAALQLHGIRLCQNAANIFNL
jgi:hypothetical protein